MEPTLRDGDLLLAVPGIPARAGRIAMVRLPPDRDGAPRPVAVKRLVGRDPDAPLRWWVDCDNPREGVTSFEVGSLAEQDVGPVVLFRLPRLRRLSQL